METDNSRIRIAKKIYSPPKDTPKKKKQNKKDADSKHPEPLDIGDQKLLEPEPSANPQLVQYVFKLRHQLLETEKELKFEQTKFKHLITSIAGYFDKGGRSLLETPGCEKLLQELGNQSEQEPGFENFFTTHKYQISDKKQDHVEEDEHNNDQKSKAKASKASKASGGLIKINLKDMEVDKPEIQLDKEPAKRPKKKKASSPPAEEEKESKKKRIKKSKGNEEGSAMKGMDMSKPVMISPHEKEGVGHEDSNKVRKAEETLNKYEDMAHMKSGHDSFERMMQQNNMFNDGLKYLVQQTKVDPTNMLNQQLLRGGLGYNPMMPGSETIDQAKLVQELLKQGIQDPILMGMNPTQDFLNYYQRSFQS